MVGSGLMPFQRAKSSNPLSLFGDKIGRWMGKVLPPILPAPGALPARTTIEVTTQKNWGWARLKELAPLHFLFSLMISGGLSRPGGEMLRAGQTVGAYLSAPLHFASAEREHKKHISLLQRWK
jgi:hypothetical protein